MEAGRRPPRFVSVAGALKFPHGTTFVCEGEKDADRVASLGHYATTVAAGDWSKVDVSVLAGREVFVLADNDETGRKKALAAANKLRGVAATTRIIRMPDGAKDVSDWLDAEPSRAERLVEVCVDTPLWEPETTEKPPVPDEAEEAEANDGAAPEHDVEGVSLDSFHAYMPTHQYIFAPTGEMWPASSVDARLPPMPKLKPDGTPVLDKKGNPIFIHASMWLDINKPVEQMTWAPGEPVLIRDRVIQGGGWVPHEKLTVFNLYCPPIIKPGDAALAGKWRKHVETVFGDAADHIVKWLACRVQRPDDKVNHALVLGGMQGIGKDTLLVPVKHAIGPWNFAEASPQQMQGRFNSFIKSVILRVSEARDLGDFNRYQFYEHCKQYIAAPPEVLRCDEKHVREHAVLNCTGVIITTNHKVDGIYLPADDRRHYVAWSPLTKDDFSGDYWTDLWAWYKNGGIQHVAAYLGKLDLAGFDPKAPPPKTEAFFEIVNANRAPEDSELSDVLDDLGRPDVVTVDQVMTKAFSLLHVDFGEWLKDRRNSRSIPHRFEDCNYTAVRNPNDTEGRWKIDGKRHTIYGKKTMTERDRIAAAIRLVRAR